MNIRVVTLRYSESLGGFPEEPLRQVLAAGNVVDQREYFFTHGGVPHLALVLVLDGTSPGASAGLTPGRAREDPGDKLPEHLQPLYRSLRQWRNERAKRADDLGFPLASTVPFVPAPRGRGLAWIAHKKPQITLIARISAS